MSGHSKWSTIKHKKALTDAKKGRIFSKISRMITVAVREKGPSPDTNLSLRLALEKAKEANMPAENIQRAIQKYSADSGEQLEEVQFEGYGPGGVALVIEAITDSRNRTSQEIRHILSSGGGNMASPGSVLWMFEKCGHIIIDDEGKNREDIELAAIEAGAEDVRGEGEKIAILTKPENMYRTKKALEEKGIAVEKAWLDYQAKNTVAIADASLQKQVEELYEALDNYDDVQEIYSNAQFEN